jgi:hypothetical protein
LKGAQPSGNTNTTKKINERVYPGKTDDEIKSHLESVRELEISATHTHALLSASVSKGLRSYMQAVTKGKPNPYVLWHALKDRFHNKLLNLQANLQHFSQAHKEGDEQMMDFIARLQQLRLLASTDSSPIGDDNFVARLRAGLPSEYNSTQSTIASYLKSVTRSMWKLWTTSVPSYSITRWSLRTLPLRQTPQLSGLATRRAPRVVRPLTSPTIAPTRDGVAIPATASAPTVRRRVGQGRLTPTRASLSHPRGI